MHIHVQKKQGDFYIDAAFDGAGQGTTALYGSSGAGKTSIINMVAGLSRPDRGTIAVNGQCLFDAAKNICLPPEKRRIGYIFQEGRLFPHLSVRGNLMYGLRLTPSSRRFIAVPEVVELLGIAHLLHRRPKHLSGGEKQRVAIGRALLANPSLLLMDEPLSGLDAARKQELLPFIKQLNSVFAVPILYVSHSLDEIAALAHTVVVLENGQVTACGPAKDIVPNQQARRPA